MGMLNTKLRCVSLRSTGNKAYPLNLRSAELLVYCHMTNDLGICGNNGWTLVMKTNGNKVLHENTLQFLIERIYNCYFQITALSPQVNYS